MPHSQSKKHSAYESIMNIVIGMFIALGAQLIIFPTLGIAVTLDQNIIIMLFFTVISFCRSYLIRRFWNWRSAGGRYFKRKPDFLIGPENSPYLRRWWIIPRNKIFNVYLHNILKDDDDRALHDHPWWNVSILLKGGLTEVRQTRKGQRVRKFRRFIPILRSGKALHRLVLPDGSTGAWTLFLTGPRYREWGFQCPSGWVFWKDFVAPGDKGKIGAGCGEH